MPPPPPRIPIWSSYICSSCRRRSLNAHSSTIRRLSSSRVLHAKTSGSSEDIDDYYSLLLSSPQPVSASSTRPKQRTLSPQQQQQQQPAPKSPPPPASDSAGSRARIVFGSRLAGPTERAERARERDAQATVVAGVRVPPRPAEPDNCCMSGCVNCVWDLYREELEDWAAKRWEAAVRMNGPRSSSSSGGGGPLVGTQSVVGGARIGEAAEAAASSASMDEDGGGSDTNWDASATRLPSDEEGELFLGVPVGIRQFMATEKRLAEKRRRREKERERELMVEGHAEGI